MSATDKLLVAEAGGQAPGRNRLAGRRVLVIGAGQESHGLADAPVGNGRAMSILFGREGAVVAVADLNPSAAEETAELVQKEGAKAIPFTVEASDEASVKQLIQASVAALGGLDGLVLNVGIAGGFGLTETSLADWEKVFAVNVRAHFLGCKYGLLALAEGGSIVLISSVAAFMSSGEMPAYTSSKAALSGLCLSVAREAALKGVRVNLVVPGLIDTALGRKATQQRPARASTPVPLGRQGTAWEVAYAATFLLSNEASYITGQSMVVDGGLLAIR